jgi:hypothetical protein
MFPKSTHVTIGTKMFMNLFFHHRLEKTKFPKSADVTFATKML